MSELARDVNGIEFDGCEWNPDDNRLSMLGDQHFETSRATWLVGGRADNYRLCDSCAVLPRFIRKRRRIRIVGICAPCPHGNETGVWSGCQVDICPYDAEHHVHHGIGTLVFDPHPFTAESR